MDSTTTPAVDRRRAHRRVGTAAVLAFAALLALGLARNAAQADPATPAIAPAATATPEQTVPRQVMPFVPGEDPGGDGFRGRHFRGGGGGFGGGGTAPAPSTGGGNET